MRILHLAVENFAGIPMRLVHEERRRGHESRLVTLLSPMQKYEEDIALQLPALNLPQMKFLRRLVRGTPTEQIVNTRHAGTAKLWQSANMLDNLLFRLRDAAWQPAIRRALKEIGGLESFDLIIADGGHDFTRFPRLLATTSVPIATVYYGSDMRTRGIIAGVQEKACFTFTFEHDHTLLFPEAKFLFYPYEAPNYAPFVQYQAPIVGESIRIGHAPTNRAAKGTEQILGSLERLKKDFPIEIVLIEKMPHPEALRTKAQCHLFIDQIGELGYGVNSLESLAMGIPTAVELMPDFERFLENHSGDEAHPFYTIRRARLDEDVRFVLSDIQQWQNRGRKGKEWVKRHHATEAVVDTYLECIRNTLAL
ncbi:MAG: hypothetical protein JNN25_15080 [Candidatus Kapabacteria bacterium]|nr:hypothetical protein [Candidatus Kapabacteria bacterium]